MSSASSPLSNIEYIDSLGLFPRYIPIAIESINTLYKMLIPATTFVAIINILIRKNTSTESASTASKNKMKFSNKAIKNIGSTVDDNRTLSVRLTGTG